ncbi:MAG: hypothetical protein J6T56_09240 [Bacteroidales bacterium]|nr:hypothetical protein [Bacteroidales bacterium]MBP5613919.1 hypothetical protein [Bacteroidales bacterium]
MTIKNENLKPVTFSLKVFYITTIIAIVIFGIISLITAAFLIGIGAWKAVFIPVIWACIPVVIFIVFKESRKKTFITISSEGLTFCGTVDPWRNYRKDFSIVHHFRWEEIRQLSFTRIATAPAYLFIDPNEGETKCIFIYRGWNLIDKLRNFTGFHGCRELGNHFQYLKQEGPEKAAE